MLTETAYTECTIFFFFAPSGHIATLFPVQTLYLEPRSRPYEIRIYLHCSSLRALNCRSVQAYMTPNSCGEGLHVNLFGVRPIPTGYSLHALNPLLPGLEPGPPKSTLIELHCWCLVGPVWSPRQTSLGWFTRPGSLGVPVSLGLMRPQIQALGQGSVEDKPRTS